MPISPPALLISEPRAGVRVLTISNESKRNAVDEGLLERIRLACDEAEADGVRCLVMTGAGEKAFSAGFDLNALAIGSTESPLPDEALQRTLATMERGGAPILAALNGATYGAGAEIAAACDLRIADPRARIAMPPARLGIVYAPAGLQRFVELVGLPQAKRLFYTGDPIDAEKALAIGLIDEVAEEGQALSQALHIAERIARNAPRAVQGMKRAFHLMRRRELPQAVQGEMEALRRASFSSEDAVEGIRAALEKREPRFTGN